MIFINIFFHEIIGQCWIEFWAYPHASCQWQFGGQQCWGHATQNLFANDVNKWRLRPPPHRNKLSKTGVDLRRSFTASGKKNRTFFFREITFLKNVERYYLFTLSTQCWETLGRFFLKKWQSINWNWGSKIDLSIENRPQMDFSSLQNFSVENNDWHF